MIATPGSTPSRCAASSTIGPWTANCPPPEGTNRLTRPAATKVSSPNVAGDATPTKASDSTEISPVAVMMPRIPAYSGNWSRISPTFDAAFLTSAMSSNGLRTSSRINARNVQLTMSRVGVPPST